MKLSIENIDGKNIKVTLNYKNKEYTELWVDDEYSYIIKGTSITDKLKKEGLFLDEKETLTFKNSYNVAKFMYTANSEKIKK